MHSPPDRPLARHLRLQPCSRQTAPQLEVAPHYALPLASWLLQLGSSTSGLIFLIVPLESGCLFLLKHANW